MEITAAQFNFIEKLLPLQRGNVKLSDLNVLNAILYVAEYGCKWRNLPKKFGNWHSIYTRANRWAKNGVLDRVFIALQKRNIIQLQLDQISLENTLIKIHSKACSGALKKTVLNLSVSHEGIGPPKFTWLRLINGQQ